MPAVPAYCDSCGSFFPTPIHMENSKRISFSGVHVGCPVCGGVGRVPDGTYDFVGNTITLLSGPDATAKRLERLAALLSAAASSKESRDSIAAQVKREVPELSRLADILPQKRSELYAFIALILSIITMLLANFGTKQTQITIEQVFNTVLNQAPTPISPDKAEGKANPGRNDKCPCGSGKKYEKCHGASH